MCISERCHLIDTTRNFNQARQFGPAQAFYPPQILPLKYSPSSLSSMSRRPGPKPNFDISYLGGVASVNAKQFEVVEQLLPFIVGTNPDENTTQLLQELRRLNQEAADLKEGHGFFFCEICEKSFCDAKGVRRHILATFDEPHRELKREVTSLTCRYCDRTFKKRESVSKHQNACPNNGESWAFPFRFWRKGARLMGNLGQLGALPAPPTRLQSSSRSPVGSGTSAEGSPPRQTLADFGSPPLFTDPGAAKNIYYPKSAFSGS